MHLRRGVREVERLAVVVEVERVEAAEVERLPRERTVRDNAAVKEVAHAGRTALPPVGHEEPAAPHRVERVALRGEVSAHRVRVLPVGEAATRIRGAREEEETVRRRQRRIREHRPPTEVAERKRIRVRRCGEGGEARMFRRPRGHVDAAHAVVREKRAQPTQDHGERGLLARLHEKFGIVELLGRALREPDFPGDLVLDLGQLLAQEVVANRIHAGEPLCRHLLHADFRGLFVLARARFHVLGETRVDRVLAPAETAAHRARARRRVEQLARERLGMLDVEKEVGDVVETLVADRPGSVPRAVVELVVVHVVPLARGQKLDEVARFASRENERQQNTCRKKSLSYEVHREFRRISRRTSRYSLHEGS